MLTLRLRRRLSLGLANSGFLSLCAVLLALPAIATAQPNLQPTGIALDTSTAVVGGTVFFDSGVSNTGDVDTDVFNIKWFVNGQEVGAYGSHAGVPAGQTVIDGNSQFSWTFGSPGSHSVTFTVDVDNHVLESNEGDNAGSVSVTVTDPAGSGQTPVITLLGDNPLNHIQGCPFAGAGATAIDAEDGDLTNSIIITGTETIDNPGMQTLTYSVTDSSGLSDVKTRQVIVFGVIGTPGCLLGKPEGKAPNLIVYVHGCCTNAEDVGTLRIQFSEAYKGQAFLQENGGWEIVVWDWSKDTTEPIPGPAYDKAELQAADLNIAISSFPYKYVHMIGHSAGARLIDIAANNLADLHQNVPSIKGKPFIHLTFLDAYRPAFDDYGNLEQKNYPKEKHYVEHYVDVNLLAHFTNDYLPHAFNFDITNWEDEKDDKPHELGHQWPVRWYTRSIEFPARTGDLVGLSPGFSLSLEGGNEQFCTLAEQFPSGGECQLRNAASAALCGNIVLPAPCR